MEQKVVQKAPEQAKKSKPNLTGIPTQMKLDFEQRSGLSFDDVRVHYNSDKPRKIGALAYTQIPQVHIGPGQERHLRHELGHVVQQKQGIVRPTTWFNGLPVNDSTILERNASDATKVMFFSGYNQKYSAYDTIQMLAMNPASETSKVEGRCVIDMIHLRDSQKEPKTTGSTDVSGMSEVNIVPVDTTVKDDKIAAASVPVYFLNQYNWIKAYAHKCNNNIETIQNKEVSETGKKAAREELSHIRKASLISATCLGQDAFVLFGNKAHRGENLASRIRIGDDQETQLLGRLNEARLLTAMIQKASPSPLGLSPVKHDDSPKGIVRVSIPEQTSTKQWTAPCVANLTYQSAAPSAPPEESQKTVIKSLNSKFAAFGRSTTIPEKLLTHETTSTLADISEKLPHLHSSNLGLVPKYLHPDIAQSIRTLTEDGNFNYFATMGAGTHAEIYVVNKYLKEKEYTPGSQMRADLVIANLHGRVTPRSPDELVELREFAMCPHCATILNSTLLSQHNITHCHGEKPPAQTKRQQPAPSYSGQKRMHETGGNRARSMEGGRPKKKQKNGAP